MLFPSNSVNVEEGAVTAITITYWNNEDFEYFCGMLDEIAFVPLDQATNAMSLPQSKAPEVAHITI